MKCPRCFHQMRLNPYWTETNSVGKNICLDCGKVV